MENIYLITTEKPSLLYLNTKSNQLCRSYSVTSQGGWVSNRHIYITSEEEVKDGCYVIEDYGGVVYGPVDKESIIKNPKKIILTTDPDLITDGVQEIPEEFLEYLVKNPSCEWVEVDHERVLWEDGRITHYKYKIIIPQDQTKQETVTQQKQQTAVEWLVEKIQNNIHHTIKIPIEYFEQALEMEKEQIIDAYNQGSLDTYKKEPKNGQGTKYYNETYGNR